MTAPSADMVPNSVANRSETGLAALRRLLAGPAVRVAALDWNGGRAWLKRPEVPASWRWRVQKGNPARAFRREVEGLRALAALGAPVPRILDAGPAHLLLADAGPTVDSLLADPAIPPEDQAAAVLGAARALAGLHGRGLAHGRPYLRDICWDGQRATLIDLERFRPRSSALRQGADLVLFLASLLSHPVGAGLARPAMAALREGAPAAALRAASAWVAALRLLAPLARRVLRRKPKNREIAGYLRLLELWPDLRVAG